MINKKLGSTIAIAVVLVAALLSPSVISAQAIAAVNIKFATDGLHNITGGTVFTIDDTIQVDYWDLSWRTFQWAAGSTHKIEATTPMTGWDGTVYSFSSWTNGNGLTQAAGTFTVPSYDTTVTANYGLSTVEINFATTILPTFTGGIVLTIDGTGIDYYDLPSTHFTWEKGSTHEIEVSTPLTGWDGTVYSFLDWTNANDLTGTSGNYTTPNFDANVTANYVNTTQPLATDLTISLTPQTVNPFQTPTTVITGTLTNDCTVLPTKTIHLSYSNGGDWISITTTTTQPNGTYAFSWDVPSGLTNGLYVIKAEFAGDSTYASSTAATGTTDNGQSLLVVPEYAWGGLTAMIMCLAAMVLYKKRDCLLHRKHQ